MKEGREKRAEALDCCESCYSVTLIKHRRGGDFDGGCHWWRYHIYIVDGRINWLRKHGGTKKDGLTFAYLQRGPDVDLCGGVI